MTAIEVAPVNNTLLANHLESLGWERIETHMTGQSWPPTSQDWQTLQISWAETPKQKSLNQIADAQIRGATYMYSEVADHTLRLKAMAHFFGLFGAKNKGIALTFLIWKQCAKLAAMQALDPSVLTTTQ